MHPEFRTIEQAAEGKSARGYYVAVLRVGDLRAAGIDVIGKPVEGNPGHAELPSLTSANRDTPKAEETMKKLAERLTLRVEGPFLPASGQMTEGQA
jgi:hypothetical protein